MLLDLVVLLDQVLLQYRKMLQQILPSLICDFLPEISYFQVFAESVCCQLVFTDEEEILHLSAIQFFAIVHELHVQRLLKHIDQALREFHQVPVVLLDISRIHVHDLLLHFELDLLFVRLVGIAGRGK